MSTLYFSVSLLAVSVVFFVIGYYEGKRQPNKTVLISQWPNGSIQWDSQMSQAQILAFLDKVRDFVLANPLAQPKSEKPPVRSIVPTTAKEQAND